MQQEAIRRVKEMQKRSNSYISSPNNQHDKPVGQKPVENRREAPLPHNNQQNNKNAAYNDFMVNSNKAQQRNSAPSRNNANAPKQSPDTPSRINKPALNNNKGEEKKPEHSHNNRPNVSSPFSQLFGSNLAGFNKVKKDGDSENSLLGSSIVTDITGSISKLFSDFSIDEEKLLILILIYILYKNGADIKLLLALGYLII